MLLSGVNQVGMRGLQYGMEGLRQDATELADARQLEGNADNIAPPLLDENLQLQQLQSAAKVIDVGTEVFRTTIDITA
ncbi:hypothetical protein CKO12_07315 [Chromatium okenii]|uniref:hypothetical protein n=1 Tax=Chromatium okenii TaxID=61644 RepID=UPI00190525EB|nr:hypothetical protein [Chromatium okenii]MBK1641686.1 hypothetical protein [Chromatium okenii]